MILTYEPFEVNIGMNMDTSITFTVRSVSVVLRFFVFALAVRS